MGDLYFRQLLAGRDFGVGDQTAAMMQNYVYLIGDRDTRECVIVDPAWNVRDLLRVVADDDMRVVGALATHYHPDHVGGSMMGFNIDGLPTLLALNPCKVHAHKLEVPYIRKVTGLDESDLTKHEANDVVRVGDIEIELLHTPGHTPGSLCFRLQDSLVAGDTLFLQGCGRVDLPGSDPEQMYYSLTQRLAKLPGDLTLFPGHAYSGAHAPLEEVRKTNPYLSVPNLETWLRAMGG